MLHFITSLHLLHFFAGLLHSYGYIALFVALVVEYLVFVIPGEPFLLLAAAYSATGRLSLPLVVVSAALGAAVGLNNAYWIGRRGGQAFVQGHVSRFRVSTGDIDRLQRFFERHGAPAVFWLRFVTVLRILVGYMAGVEGMNFRVFTLFNLLGAFAWATAIGLLGFTFAHNLRLLRHVLTDVGFIAAVIILVVAVVLWRRRAQRSEVRATATEERPAAER